MNFLELFQTFGSNVWIYGGTFVVVLSILVFVHEWGHYIIARLCGVRVESFSIGFGRELFGYNDKNGTRWKFSLIPLGGYVKLYGDVDPASAQHCDQVEDGASTRSMTAEERNQAFFSKPVWKRAAVVFAGPAINYIFAIILLSGLYVFNGKPVTPPVAAAVITGSSADKFGFKPHDLILEIDGKPIYSFEDIRREMMIALDETRNFLISRDGQTVMIEAKPEKVEEEDRFGFKQSRGMLGLISPRHAIALQNLLSVDGVEFAKDDFEGKRRALTEKMGQQFTIEVTSENKRESLIVNPKAEFNAFFNTAGHKESEILYVVNKDSNELVQFTPVNAVGAAFYQTYVITTGTLEAIWQMITGARSAQEMGGIIRIGAVAGDMAQQGIVALILFMALLSINLGLINLFPIPLLDGGHLVFYAFEAVLGKPIPDQIQEYAFRLGLVFLVCVMVFANLNDIMQLIL
jgi:regulator of sigma E protease